MSRRGRDTRGAVRGHAVTTTATARMRSRIRNKSLPCANGMHTSTDSTTTHDKPCILIVVYGVRRRPNRTVRTERGWR
jgi:hypothetical protein